MTDITDLGIRFEKLKNDMDLLAFNSNITEVLHSIKQGDLPKELDEYNQKLLKDIIKNYQIGIKFSRNQEKIKKRDFLHDTYEECLRELESIKILYSERTYYRWKRRLKDKFPDK